MGEKKKVSECVCTGMEIKRNKAARETERENDRQRDNEEERKEGGQRELTFHY